MKPIRFFSNTTDDKFTFSVIVNKKALIELIQKSIVHAYIYLSFLCGLVALLIMGTCCEKSTKPTTGQIVATIICSFIFLSLIRMINPKKFDEFFINIWEIIKNLFARIPRIFA